MKFTEHTVNHFKGKNSVSCSTFPVSYNHLLYLVLKYFHHSRRETLHSFSSSSHFPLPQPLATTNLPSVSMASPILNILYKWNRTVCGLLCLASFTEHHVFKVHPCCSLC